MPVATEKYLTVPEVAAEFRVSRRTVYRAIERQELAAVRFGARLRVPVAAIEELLRPIKAGFKPEEDA